MTEGLRASDVEVDVAAAVRERAGRYRRMVGVGLPCYVAGFALLHLGPGGWTAGGWAVAAGLVAGVLLAHVLGRVLDRTRWQQSRYVAEHAVLHHLDPGLGRRQAADRRARDMSWGRSFALVWVALLAVQTVSGDLDDPVWAAAGIALFALVLAVLVPPAVLEARAARRWLADPPGPPRDRA